jgi:hypothetical protein
MPRTELITVYGGTRGKFVLVLREIILMASNLAIKT